MTHFEHLTKNTYVNPPRKPKNLILQSKFCSVDKLTKRSQLYWLNQWKSMIKFWSCVLTMLYSILGLLLYGPCFKTRPNPKRKKKELTQEIEQTNRKRAVTILYHTISGYHNEAISTSSLQEYKLLKIEKAASSVLRVHLQVKTRWTTYESNKSYPDIMYLYKIINFKFFTCKSTIRCLTSSANERTREYVRPITSLHWWEVRTCIVYRNSGNRKERICAGIEKPHEIFRLGCICHFFFFLERTVVFKKMGKKKRQALWVHLYTAWYCCRWDRVRTVLPFRDQIGCDP